jgi:hypothetical protein
VRCCCYLVSAFHLQPTPQAVTRGAGCGWYAVHIIIHHPLASCHLPYCTSLPSITIPIHPASKHLQRWWWSLSPPLLYYPSSIGAVSSAKSCIIPVNSYPHPPCKQTLAAVMVELVTAIVLLSIVHLCHVICHIICHRHR